MHLITCADKRLQDLDADILLRIISHVGRPQWIRGRWTLPSCLLPLTKMSKLLRNAVRRFLGIHLKEMCFYQGDEEFWEWIYFAGVGLRRLSMEEKNSRAKEDRENYYKSAIEKVLVALMQTKPPLQAFSFNLYLAQTIEEILARFVQSICHSLEHLAITISNRATVMLCNIRFSSLKRLRLIYRCDAIWIIVTVFATIQYLIGRLT